MESEHAQNVQGSFEGPSRVGESPQQIDPTVLLATLTAIQRGMTNIATMLEHQSIINNIPTAPTLTHVQPGGRFGAPACSKGVP